MTEEEVLDRYQITKSTLQSIICRKRMKPMVDYYTLDSGKYGFTPKGVDILVDHFECDRMLNEWLRRMALNLVEVEGICDRTALSKEVVKNFIKDKFSGSRYSYVTRFYEVFKKEPTKSIKERKDCVESAKNDVKRALKNILGEEYESFHYYK